MHEKGTNDRVMKAKLNYMKEEKIIFNELTIIFIFIYFQKES